MAIIAIFVSDSEPYSYLVRSLSVGGFPVEDAEVSIEQYLHFAASDLANETAQGTINALGNAKRALHLTIDNLLSAYGLLTHNKRQSFPHKLELLDGAGLFTLSILKTLNLERNVMEHEYKVPDRSRVLETIDVAQLLLLATRRMQEHVTCEFLAGWREGNRHGVVQLDPPRGTLAFHEVAWPKTRVDEPNIEVLNPIRTLRGELLEGAVIAAEPFWSFDLSFRDMSHWSPLLQPIIESQDWASSPHSTVISSDNEYQVSVRISLPSDLGDGLFGRLEGIRTARLTKAAIDGGLSSTEGQAAEDAAQTYQDSMQITESAANLGELNPKEGPE